MSDELRTLALDLARRIGENAKSGGAQILDAGILAARERTLLIAVHDALAADDLEPLRNVLGGLDAFCQNMACDQASHPDGLGYCMFCHEQSQREAEPDPEFDNRFDLLPLS